MISAGLTSWGARWLLGAGRHLVTINNTQVISPRFQQLKLLQKREDQKSPKETVSGAACDRGHHETALLLHKLIQQIQSRTENPTDGLLS